MLSNPELTVPDVLPPADALRVRRGSFDEAALRTWWKAVDSSVHPRVYFRTFAWNAAWSRTYVDPHPGREALLLVVEDSETIHAVLPLFLQSRRAWGRTVWRYALWNGHELSPMPDMVTPHRTQEVLWQVLLRFMIANVPDAWLQLDDIETGHPLATLPVPEGWQRRQRKAESRLQLHLSSEDAGELITGFSAHLRKRARRYLREGDLYSWEFHTWGSEALLEDLKRLNMLRFAQKSWFADPRAFAFMQELHRTDPSHIWYAVLREGEETASVLMGFRDDPAALRYVLSGLHPAHVRRDAGMRNLLRVVYHAASSGVACLDFLRGNEMYKRQFSPRRVDALHLTLLPASVSMRYALALAGKRVRGTWDAAWRRSRA